ncbi:MAG: hypothetical protein QOD84_2106 [Acidobacteriaceae bacterium]|jgi:hypothetical protein
MNEETQSEDRKAEPSSVSSQNPLDSSWSTFRAHVSKTPRWAWIVLGVFLTTALSMALYTRILVKNDALLNLRVQHTYRSAKLSVWIDRDLTYTTKLTGAAKKKSGPTSEAVQSTLAESLTIPSGIHELRVQITAEDGTVRDKTISGAIPSGSERTLSISARRSNLSLNWKDSSFMTASSASASTPPPIGIQRYLVMTVIGSIVSAITGFAVREFPKQLSSREEKA